MDPQAENRTIRIELDVFIQASLERVFEALTAQVGSWWTVRFHVPSIVRMEPWPGGEFVEEWDDEGVRYATVTRVKPGVLLSLTGPMAMGEETEGTIDFVLAGTRGGTSLTLIHRATGDVSDEVEASYRDGWHTLLNGALRPFVETGAIPGALRGSDKEVAKRSKT